MILRLYSCLGDIDNSKSNVAQKVNYFEGMAACAQAQQVPFHSVNTMPSITPPSNPSSNFAGKSGTSAAQATPAAKHNPVYLHPVSELNRRLLEAAKSPQSKMSSLATAAAASAKQPEEPTVPEAPLRSEKQDERHDQYVKMRSPPPAEQYRKNRQDCQEKMRKSKKDAKVKENRLQQKEEPADPEAPFMSRRQEQRYNKRVEMRSQPSAKQYREGRQDFQEKMRKNNKDAKVKEKRGLT